jgi:TPP-dependent pyruvate/acetoin dehydrogenase alpha subunit
VIKNIKKKLFFQILRIRSIEETIAKKYSEFKMRCPVHLSIGQETSAVAICQNLSLEDKVFTAHRSHAHYLAKGGNLKAMIAELHGKKTGCAKGKGGSMHLIDLKAGILGAVPIVGSTIPIGTGVAWGEKLKKSKNVVVIFFGDGATEEGVFQESLDFASLHNLAILFVCENNDYSVYSNLRNRQYKNRNILKIADSIGIKGLHITMKANVLEVYNTINSIIKKIKKKKRPFLVLIDNFRHLEHCGPNNDDNLNYRSKKYLRFGLNNCPIKIYKKFLIKKKIISNVEITKYIKLIDKEINSAFFFAEQSRYPVKKELFNNVYDK